MCHRGTGLWAVHNAMCLAHTVACNASTLHWCDRLEQKWTGCSVNFSAFRHSSPGDTRGPPSKVTNGSCEFCQWVKITSKQQPERVSSTAPGWGNARQLGQHGASWAIPDKHAPGHCAASPQSSGSRLDPSLSGPRLLQLLCPVQDQLTWALYP